MQAQPSPPGRLCKVKQGAHQPRIRKGRSRFRTHDELHHEPHLGRSRLRRSCSTVLAVHQCFSIRYRFLQRQLDKSHWDVRTYHRFAIASVLRGACSMARERINESSTGGLGQSCRGLDAHSESSGMTLICNCAGLDHESPKVSGASDYPFN